MEPPVFSNLTRVDPLTVAFTLKPTQVAYANTLRRMILTGVESVAFRSDMNEHGGTTDVSITTNTTPMTNEMLADRIGLIPIHVEDPLSWNPDEYIFSLNVANDSFDPRDVTAADFEVRKVSSDPNEPATTVGNTKFFHPNKLTGSTALITVLKGHQAKQAPQEIKLTARATVGTGRDHIRFSSVSQCSYSYTIDPDPARQQTFFERWLRNNKKVEPKSLEGDETRKKALEREFETMEVQRCFLIDEKGEPYSFDFVIETMGIQDAPQLVDRALQNIETKCLKYMDLLTLENITVRPAEARMKGFDFLIQGEDHTLGNLFQSWMESNLMDINEITYVGYKIPHPLRDEMVLRIGVEDGQEVTARAALMKAAKGCAEMFHAWREDWTRVTGAGMGTRTRASLRPTVKNATAVVAASASVAAIPATSAATATATGKRSAFWGKK
jgi:DNA-directed RNA polymerase subunit L